MEVEARSGGVLVIGGSGGLGRAIVRRLALDWPKVTLTWRSRQKDADEIVATLSGQTEIGALQLDLSRRDAIAPVIEAAAARMRGLGALVFASGVGIEQPYVSTIKAAQWDEVIQVELVGFLEATRAALPLLRETRGCIVNIGSFATRWFPQGDALSAVPKAGTEMLCRAIAKEEGRYGVRANTVAPGIIAAGLGKSLMDSIFNSEIWEVQRKRTPLRRFGAAEDIANAAAFLASSQSSYITGQTIIVDGGLSL